MFTIQYVKNLQWEDEAHTVFSCIAKYEEFDEEHPTGVNPTDSYAHIKQIWNKGLAGEYGTISEYVPPPPPPIPKAKPLAQQPTSEGTQTL
jgi:hypothetical protein